MGGREVEVSGRSNESKGERERHWKGEKEELVHHMYCMYGGPDGHNIVNVPLHNYHFICECTLMVVDSQDP